MLKKSIMYRLRNDTKSTFDSSHCSKNQFNTVLRILIFAYYYLPSSEKEQGQNIKILTKSLTNQYWYSADYGIHHLLLGCYKILHPTAKKSIRKLQTHLRKQENTMELTNYEFAKEPLIVNMLYNSFFSRYVLFVWINLFEHEKRLYTVEVLQDAHHELVFAKKLMYLLQGVVLADDKMHLSSFKGYPKRIITKRQWCDNWEKRAEYVSALWD